MLFFLFKSKTKNSLLPQNQIKKKKPNKNKEKHNSVDYDVKRQNILCNYICLPCLNNFEEFLVMKDKKPHIFLKIIIVPATHVMLIKNNANPVYYQRHSYLWDLKAGCLCVCVCVQEAVRCPVGGGLPPGLHAGRLLPLPSLGGGGGRRDPLSDCTLRSHRQESPDEHDGRFLLISTVISHIYPETLLSFRLLNL